MILKCSFNIALSVQFIIVESISFKLQSSAYYVYSAIKIQSRQLNNTKKIRIKSLQSTIKDLDRKVVLIQSNWGLRAVKEFL